MDAGMRVGMGGGTTHQHPLGTRAIGPCHLRLCRWEAPGGATAKQVLLVRHVPRLYSSYCGQSGLSNRENQVQAAEVPVSNRKRSSPFLVLWPRLFRRARSSRSQWRGRSGDSNRPVYKKVRILYLSTPRFVSCSLVYSQMYSLPVWSAHPA